MRLCASPPRRQVYPKTFLGEASLYDQAWWRWLVAAWEAAVFNPLLDLQAAGAPLAAAVLVAYLTRRRWTQRLKAWWQARAGMQGLLLFWRRRRPSHSQAKAQMERDLDV